MRRALHLAADGLVEAAVLAADGAEGPDQRHVADDVGQLAFDPGCPAGEAVMQGRPAAASRNSSSMMTAEIAVRAAAIGMLTAARKAMAPTVATQGGSTFQMKRFSTAKAAFEVAVTRPVRVPDRRW